MAKRHHLSTKKRMKAILAIVREEYEPGNQRRCYKAIWRRRIKPEFGVCYKTLLVYLDTPPSELEETKPAEGKSQLRLFEEQDEPTNKDTTT